MMLWSVKYEILYLRDRKRIFRTNEKKKARTLHPALFCNYSFHLPIDATPLYKLWGKTNRTTLS